MSETSKLTRDEISDDTFDTLERIHGQHPELGGAFARATRGVHVDAVVELLGFCVDRIDQIQRQAKGSSFQDRVRPWMLETFGAAIADDQVERGDRFIEEAIELLQSAGYAKERILALADYVYSRPIGEMDQETGGVMVTLAGFCLTYGIDMHQAGEAELARVWTKVEQIRAKQAAKPTGSALPVLISMEDLVTDDVRPRVASVLKDTAGAYGTWVTCSGCHETEDGHDVGHYPWSEAFGCKLGGGCTKCGGIGAIWDTTDYADMAKWLLEDDEATPLATPALPALVRPHLTDEMVEAGAAALEAMYKGAQSEIEPFGQMARAVLTAALEGA